MLKKIYALFFLLLLTGGESSEKTICLNMIVKNESPVIARCLDSIKPFIDYWVIVDTGSTDETKKIIQETLKEIPGELHEQAWVNFGYNRNEALKLAKGKGDYLLFIDADEQLEGFFGTENLEKDVYLVTLRTCKDPLSTCLRAFLINNHLSWQWQGVLHESLKYEGERSFELLADLVLSAESKEGHRSQDPQKHLKDAYTLEKALKDDPNNSDYVYYLAQSYYNAQELALSLKNYEKRSKMDGWDQHTFWSKYYMGHIQELLKMDPKHIIKSYSDAFQYRPIRAEPLCRLANYFYNQKNFLLGYLLAQHGLAIERPNDIVYVEDWIYSYGMLAVFGNCAMELGKNKEASAAYEQIAQKKEIPDQIRQQAKATLQYLSTKKDTD